MSVSETVEHRGTNLRVSQMYSVPQVQPQDHDAACEKALARIHAVAAARRLEIKGEIKVTNSLRVRYHATAEATLLPAVRTSEERCELMDLPVGQCAHCRGLTDPDLEQASTWQAQPDRACGPGFLAKYPQSCFACDTPIRPGDTIHQLTKAGSGTFDYVCHACAW